MGKYYANRAAVHLSVGAFDCCAADCSRALQVTYRCLPLPTVTCRSGRSTAAPPTAPAPSGSPTVTYRYLPLRPPARPHRHLPSHTVTYRHIPSHTVTCRALQLDPTNVKAHKRLAKAHTELGAFDRAAAQLRLALEVAGRGEGGEGGEAARLVQAELAEVLQLQGWWAEGTAAAANGDPALARTFFASMLQRTAAPPVVLAMVRGPSCPSAHMRTQPPRHACIHRWARAFTGAGRAVPRHMRRASALHAAGDAAV